MKGFSLSTMILTKMTLHHVQGSDKRKVVVIDCSTSNLRPSNQTLFTQRKPTLRNNDTCLKCFGQIFINKIRQPWCDVRRSALAIEWRKWNCNLTSVTKFSSSKENFLKTQHWSMRSKLKINFFDIFDVLILNKKWDVLIYVKTNCHFHSTITLSHLIMHINYFFDICGDALLPNPNASTCSFPSVKSVLQNCDKNVIFMLSMRVLLFINKMDLLCAYVQELFLLPNCGLMLV